MIFEFLYKLPRNQNLRRRYHNTLDVVGHGTSETLQIDSLKGVEGVNGLNPKTGEVDSKLLSKIIENNPQFTGQNIRLLSCSTGACDTGIAQNVANRLNVEVSAPNDVLWACLLYTSPSPRD